MEAAASSSTSISSSLTISCSGAAELEADVFVACGAGHA